MKLDRNINKDGHGKYALINLRTNMVEWGGPGGGFFVIKLHDKFAPDAFEAYAKAVRKEAKALSVKSRKRTEDTPEVDAQKDEFEQQSLSLYEYAQEIDSLAGHARATIQKIPD